MTDEIQLTKGDYVTIRSIVQAASDAGVKPKSFYLAVAARLEAAGFPKHSGQDLFFKSSTGILGVPDLPKSIQTFDDKFLDLGGPTPDVLFRRRLTPDQVLFAGAPEWAVDVRRLHQRYVWSDGEHRYQYFNSNAFTLWRTGKAIESSLLLTKRAGIHRADGWFDYTIQLALTLPPIGTEVEARSPDAQDYMSWQFAKVIGHDDGLTVLRIRDHYFTCGLAEIRPLDWKSADPREVWKQAMLDTGKWVWEDALDTLYDMLTAGEVPSV